MIKIAKNKFYIISVVFFLIIVAFIVVYNNYIKEKQQKIILQEYNTTATTISSEIESLILTREKATLGIALSLASDSSLHNYLKKNKIPQNYYNNLVQMFEKNTLYKNIWIQVINKQGTLLYHSWTKQHNDIIAKERTDLQKIEKTHKVTYAISAGRYDLSIKAMVPVFSHKKFLGILEVISHFNSISNLLHVQGIDSVVFATKEQSKHLKYPFTKLFLDGYYIANFDAPQELRDIIGAYGVEPLLSKKYVVYKNKFIVVEPLQDINKKVIGYYIAAKDLDSLSNKDLSHFQFQWIVVTLLILMALAGVVNIIMYYSMRQQKRYYKNIIDTSNNIVLVNDQTKIVETNKSFFRYFKNFKSLEEFRKEHECICEFFVAEEGYLQKGDKGYGWLDYILEHPNKQNKVKMKIDENIYYFMVDASLISVEKNHYSVIFADITDAEKYKRELENLTVTDALTGLYNRRFYEMKILEEMRDAKRYKYALSVIMFDIDFFKKINDAHGHNVGDEVLIYYSHLIVSSVRENDFVCRIGGEEFMIILPYTEVNEAAKIAEKIRQRVENDKSILPITMSFGVTQYIPGEHEEYLYKRVDKALYEAKENGRNRVVVA